jgi:hypothetical protein
MRVRSLATAVAVLALTVPMQAPAHAATNYPGVITIGGGLGGITMSNTPPGWTCRPTQYGDPIEVRCEGNVEAKYSCAATAFHVQATGGVVRGEIICGDAAGSTSASSPDQVGYGAYNPGYVNLGDNRTFVVCRAWGALGSPGPLGNFQVVCGPDPSLPTL